MSLEVEAGIAKPATSSMAGKIAIEIANANAALDCGKKRNC
jgi:hypothetical protein